MYGINRNSILNQLQYFHVCDGSLLPDVMHDILEGALQYEVKLLLHVMIEDKNHFTLAIFNSRLKNLELGYMECNNRPTIISTKTYKSTGNSLKQSGMEHMVMFLLIHMNVFSIANVASWTYFASPCCRLCTR